MMLLKIAKELDKRNFKYTFNIYGNGSLKIKMEKYIKDNSLSNVNLISGIINLEPYYLKSDLYSITSKFEGFPLTVIEANSLSVPVVWKEMGDPTKSIMKEGINGYVLNSNNPSLFADKIIEILSSEENIKKLKKSTYESSYIYEEKNIENKWKKLFSNLFDLIK